MFVHSSRIQRQLEYLSAAGIDINPICKQAGIPKEETFPPDKTFDFEQYKAVLEFALRQTNDPDYGLVFGSQPHIGGTVGMMSASCKNLKEAFKQGCNFLQLQGDFAELQFVDDAINPRLVYKLLESWMLDSPLTAKIEVDALFAFLNTILKINSNNSLIAKKINLAFPRPQNISKYEEVFGLCPNFDAAENEMIFDESTLLIPMKAFNRETYDLLYAHLQDQLSQLDHEETTKDKVRRILHASFRYQFPDMESVADKLNLSSRTLQRKLAGEQTSFKQVLQEARFEIAKKLLRQKALTVSEISFTLGYSDLGNFSRSFKKYMGVSPLEYRGD